MNFRHFSFLLVPACAAWLGCAGGAPDTESELQDGQSPVGRDTTGGDGTWLDVPVTEGCGADGGTPSGDTVLVTSTTRFHTAVGIAERVDDLSASPLEVLVPNGSVFTRISGAAVDGGVQFSGVPSGTYYLRHGSSYILTDARHVDVGSNRLGRPDTVLTNASFSPVQLNLVGLAPWEQWRGPNLPGTALQVTSRQLDLYGGVDILDIDPTGQTSIVSAGSQMWNSTVSMPVFEADKGDRMVVNQLQPMDAGTLPDGGPIEYTAVVRSLEMGAFDFTPDGVTPMPVTGVMQPVPMYEFPIEWRLPRYTALASEVHPSATPSLPYFYVTPAAHGLADGWVGYSGELLSLQLPRGASYDFTRRLTYGNPFPSSWGTVGAVQYSFRTLQPIPSSSGGQFYLSGTMVTYDRLDRLVAGPLQPRVSPPRELSIDGVAASVAREVGTASPVISWRAPTLGTASAYRVAIYRFDPENFSLGLSILRFYVPGSETQVRLPPGLLPSKGIYHVRVAAMDSPGYDVERKPYTYGEPLPFSSAEAISSFFTTP